MNNFRHIEIDFLHSHFFVLAIVVALLLYGCSDADTEGKQQSQVKTTDTASNVAPEPENPDSTMVTEEPAMPAAETAATAMVTEEPAVPAPEMAATAMVPEEPAMPAPETTDTAMVIEAPVIPEPVITGTDKLTEAPATGPVEQQVTAVTAAAAGTAKLDGRELYNTYCAICHKSGLNAAPKYGAKPYWIKRIAQGRDVMYKHAIEGLRGMPARGGFPNLSDEEIKEAVDYMVKGSGGWGDS